MTSPVARVGVPVEPDLSSFGSRLHAGLSRDTSIASIGSQHGKSYAAAAVKSSGGAVKSGMGAVWRSVAAAGAAVGVGRVLDESVRGWRDHMKVVAQSNAVIASTKGAANVSQQAVSNLSDALERKSTVDGDVIQSGANMLLTFTNVRNAAGKGNDIFNQSTKTLLDMSVALGTDAPTSAIQLGKALNDPIRGVTALSRVGVTFDAGQRKQIETMQKHGNIAGAQKIVLAELNREFGGSAAKMGAAAGAQGKLTVAWRQAQDQVGSALLPVVDELAGALADRLPAAAAKANKWITTLRYGGEAFVAAYKEGDVTSDGFVGAMERAGVQARKFSDWLHRVDWTSFRQGAGEAVDQLKRIDFGKLGNQLKGIHTADLGHGFTVAGAGLKFLADHIGLVVKALPFLIAGFVAYKGAQAAANVAALADLPIKAGQVGANILLSRSIKALAGSQREATAAGVAGTAETAVQTAVTNAAAASQNRGRAATLAMTGAQKAGAVASRALAVGTRAVGAAMTLATGPVGLIILGVAAVATGLVVAYKRSETFRNIVNGVFGAVGKAAGFLWNNMIRPYFKFIADLWLTVVGILVNGAAKAFGWVPGIGGKLRGAATEFNKFRDKVNAALDGTTKPRSVTVSAKLLASQAAVVGIGTSGAGGRNQRLAVGGRVKGIGTETSDSIPAWLSNDEHVITAREVRGAGGHGAVEATRRQWAARGYATGGRVGQGLTIDPKLEGFARFQSVLDSFERKIVLAAARMASAGAVNAGLNGAVNFAKQIAAHGSPYNWGGTGPLGRGWDCSGWVSTLVNIAQGRKDIYSRRFSTGTLPAGLFVPGPGAFTIGWFQGNPGHVAATINGYNTETRGGDGTVGGARSRGAFQSIFRYHGHLKGFAGGGRVLPGDGPFDLLDSKGLYFDRDLSDRMRGISRHRTGLDYVPHDNYPAMLHRGERVLTATQNDALSSGAGISVEQLAAALKAALDGSTIRFRDPLGQVVAGQLVTAGGRGRGR